MPRALPAIGRWRKPPLGVDLELDPRHALYSSCIFCVFPLRPMVPHQLDDDFVPQMRDLATGVIPKSVQWASGAYNILVRSKFGQLVYEQLVTDGSAHTGLKYAEDWYTSRINATGGCAVQTKILWYDTAAQGSWAKVLAIYDGTSDWLAMTIADSTNRPYAQFEGGGPVPATAISTTTPETLVSHTSSAGTNSRYAAHYDQHGELIASATDTTITMSSAGGYTLRLGHRHSPSDYGRNFMGLIFHAMLFDSKERYEPHEESMVRDPWQIVRPRTPQIYSFPTPAAAPSTGSDNSLMRMGIGT